MTENVAKFPDSVQVKTQQLESNISFRLDRVLENV